MLSRLRFTFRPAYRRHLLDMKLGRPGKSICFSSTSAIEREWGDPLAIIVEPPPPAATRVQQTDASSIDFDLLRREIDGAHAALIRGAQQGCAAEQLTQFQAEKVSDCVHALHNAVLHCKSSEKAAAALREILSGHTVQRLVHSLLTQPREEAVELVPPIRAIVAFSAGQFPFWTSCLHRLISTTSLDDTSIEVLLNALGQYSRLKEVRPLVAFSRWAEMLTMAGDCAEKLSTNSLLSICEALCSPLEAVLDVRLSRFSQSFPGAVAVLHQILKSKPLDELYFRLPEFSVVEASRFIGPWCLLDFPNPESSAVVQSYLDFWPTADTEDTLLLLNVLQLLSSCDKKKHGIDVSQVVNQSADMLMRLPSSSLVQARGVLAFLSPHHIATVLSMLAEDRPKVDFHFVLWLLKLHPGILEHTHQLRWRVMHLVYGLDWFPSGSAGSTGPAVIQCLMLLARTFAGSSTRCAVIGDRASLERLFWKRFHDYFMNSPCHGLENALLFYQLLGSPEAAHVLTAACAQRALPSESLLYPELTVALVDIHAKLVAGGNFNDRQTLNMQRLLLTATRKRIDDILVGRIPRSDLCLQLLALQRSFPEGIQASWLLYERISQDARLMPLPRLLDTLRLALDVLPPVAPSTSLSGVISSILTQIMGSLSIAHVSAIHRSSHLDYLYCVCEEAHWAHGIPTSLSCLSAEQLAAVLPQFAAAWVELDRAQTKHLFTLDECASALGAANRYAVPASMSTQVLLRMLLTYDTLVNPTRDESRLVLDTLVSYSCGGSWDSAQVCSGDRVDSSLALSAAAALSSLGQVATSLGSGDAPYTEALSRAYRTLNAEAPTLPMDHWKEMVGGNPSFKLMATLSDSGHPLDALWCLGESSKVAEARSLLDIVSLLDKVAALFPNRPPLLNRACELVARQLLTVIERIGYGKSDGFDLRALLATSMAGSFDKLRLDWDDLFSDNLGTLGLVDLGKLFKVLRLSGIDRNEIAFHHQFLSVGICYHSSQLPALPVGTIQELLDELAASSVTYPAVKEVLAKKLEDLLMQQRVVSMPSVHLCSILNFISVAGIRSKLALEECMGQVHKSFIISAVDGTPHSVYDCCLLLAHQGVLFEANRRVLVLEWCASELCRHLLTGAGLLPVWEALSGNLTFDNSPLPTYVRWCLSLSIQTQAFAERKAPPAALANTFVALRSTVEKLKFRDWPQHETMATFGGLLSHALGDRQFRSYVTVNGHIRVPFMVAFSQDGQPLPLPVDMRTLEKPPDDTAHYVAWLVLPASQDGQVPVAALTTVRCEEWALAKRGWIVMTVREEDINSGGFDPDCIRQAVADRLKLDTASLLLRKDVSPLIS